MLLMITRHLNQRIVRKCLESVHERTRVWRSCKDWCHQILFPCFLQLSHPRSLQVWSWLSRENMFCGEASHWGDCTHHHKPPGFFFPVDVDGLLVCICEKGWCQLTHSSTSSHGLFFTRINSTKFYKVQINSVKSKRNGDWLSLFSPYLNKF